MYACRNAQVALVSAFLGSVVGDSALSARNYYVHVRRSKWSVICSAWKAQEIFEQRLDSEGDAIVLDERLGRITYAYVGKGLLSMNAGQSGGALQGRVTFCESPLGTLVILEYGVNVNLIILMSMIVVVGIGVPFCIIRDLVDPNVASNQFLAGIVALPVFSLFIAAIAGVILRRAKREIRFLKGVADNTVASLMRRDRLSEK